MDAFIPFSHAAGNLYGDRGTNIEKNDTEVKAFPI